MLTNRKVRDKVKGDFLQIALKYAAYQRKNALLKVPDHTETLKTMTSTVKKMAVAIGSKPTLQQPRAIDSSELGRKSKNVSDVEKVVQILYGKIWTRQGPATSKILKSDG